jgi:hypothetical protein
MPKPIGHGGLWHVKTLWLTRLLEPAIINTYTTRSEPMRTQTTKLLEMMDEGLISAAAVAEMALAYMSEDDVADMMRANDILEEEDEDEEEWTPENADFNDPGSRHHY